MVLEFGEKVVEVIEDGKIVKVNESYALREGLPIIRRKIMEGSAKALIDKEEERFGYDYLRKPLNWREKQEVKGLISNFHWSIIRRRREMGLNRKQVAEKIGVDEEKIKALENGIVPRGDMGLINRVEEFFNISLRKSTEGFGQSMRKLVEDSQKEEKKIDDKENEKKDFFGDDIVLLED